MEKGNLYRAERRPVASLRPSPRNARRHPASQLAKIEASIRALGFAVPILCTEDGEIVAGEARWVSARAAGLADVPVFVLAGLSALECDALRIADNALPLEATWDEDQLAEVMRDLDDAAAIPLPTLGIDETMLADLLGDAQPVAAPALPSGEREPFQRMTFTLHDSQVAGVERALAKAKAAGPFPPGPNANGNGNALERICAAYAGEGA